MKKSIVLLLYTIIVMLLFSSCGNKSTAWDYNRVMSLEKVETEGKDVIVSFNDLEEMQDYFKSRGIDFYYIEGTVNKVEYHIVFDREDIIISGYSLIDFRVDSNMTFINDSTIVLKQDSYIVFKKELDAYSFITGLHPKELDERAISELYSFDSFDKVLDYDPYVEYVRYSHGDTMFMKNGEKYTMVVYKLDEGDYYGFMYALPSDDFLDELSNNYKEEYSKEYLHLAKEIRDNVHRQ